MAMDKTLLGTAIANIITDSTASSEDKAKVKALWSDIAGAIIDHIKTNAIVTTPISTIVAGSAAVTTAPGAAVVTGSGSGTGTGTIS